jgi:ABC-type sugar transport system permease subunit
MEEMVNLPKVLASMREPVKMGPSAKREMRNGMLFIAPWLVGFLVFTLIPIVATFLFTFMSVNLLDPVWPPKFVGFANYVTMLGDSAVWNARPNSSPGGMWITLRFGLIALPVGILLPLGIALLMNNKNLKGQNLFRSLFYMPFIIPFVASIYLWAGVLNPQTGWVNMALSAMGVPNANLPGWAQDINWVYPAYVLFGIWGIGNAMLTMLAGLQGVPTELYDAAKVDGAGSIAVFQNITFPMISPIIFFNLILSVVGLFQYFLVPLAFNQGTGFPGGATMFYNLYLYKQFFQFQHMSYAAALAWMLFLMILIVTVLLFWSARYWVYYASESR